MRICSKVAVEKSQRRELTLRVILQVISASYAFKAKTNKQTKSNKQKQESFPCLSRLLRPWLSSGWFLISSIVNRKSRLITINTSRRTFTVNSKTVLLFCLNSVLMCCQFHFSSALFEGFTGIQKSKDHGKKCPYYSKS